MIAKSVELELFPPLTSEISNLNLIIFPNSILIDLLTDIDECNEKPGICRNGDCKNFEGSFQCICHNGFTLTENRESCEDIDECQRHINICNNGTCYNTVGSFMCHCYPGFKLSHNNDCIGECIFHF